MNGADVQRGWNANAFENLNERRKAYKRMRLVTSDKYSDIDLYRLKHLLPYDMVKLLQTIEVDVYSGKRLISVY